MRFLFPSFRSTRPLTAFQLVAILHAKRCTPVYRFSHVLARDRARQEYSLCQRYQLATLTIEWCQQLLNEALSSRLNMKDRCFNSEERVPLCRS